MKQLSFNELPEDIQDFLESGDFSSKTVRLVEYGEEVDIDHIRFQQSIVFEFQGVYYQFLAYFEHCGDVDDHTTFDEVDDDCPYYTIVEPKEIVITKTIYEPKKYFGGKTIKP